MARAGKKAGTGEHTTVNGKVQRDARMTLNATTPTTDGLLDPIVDPAPAPAVESASGPGAEVVTQAVAIEPIEDGGLAADLYPGDPYLDDLYAYYRDGERYGDDADDDADSVPGRAREYTIIGGLGTARRRPSRVTRDAAWAESLSRFARVAVWTLPVAAICLALTAMWGWPTPSEGPTGQSAGTWLAVTLLGLVLGLLGVIALTGLLVSTPGRRWGVVALILSVTGTVLLAPMLGVLGLARPAVTSVAGQITREAAINLEGRFFDGSVGRWLGVGGLTLLAAAWLALGCAVLASGVLNRADGWLILVAIAIAVAGSYLSWQFVLVIAAMVLLAAGLGLSWSASRLTADGPPDDD